MDEIIKETSNETKQFKIYFDRIIKEGIEKYLVGMFFKNEIEEVVFIVDACFWYKFDAFDFANLKNKHSEEPKWFVYDSYASIFIEKI